MSLNGLDVSHWQNGINLAKISADFVIMKATEGTSLVDNCCDSHYQEAKGAGKLLGVYHYASGSSSPEQQAEFFLSNIQNYIGEALLALDWEDSNLLKQGPSWAKRFLDYVYNKTGVRPLIYMSYAVTRQYDWTNVAKNYGLWVARYYTEPIRSYQSDPELGSEGTGAFSTVAIYQYSRTGRFPGIWNSDTDLDIAYMSKEAWKKYAAKSSVNSPAADTSPSSEIKPGTKITVTIDSIV